MQYALIHNNQIQVGPRNWNYYFFLEYLEDEGVNSTNLPRAAPAAAVITDDWKILPVMDATWPTEFDSTFEEPIGPFWAIHEDHITGVYNKKDGDLDAIRGILKNKVASNRYLVEVGNLEYTFADGVTVGLFTEREERNIYPQTLNVLPDGETTPFKFRDGQFRTNVSKAELAAIVMLGMIHIRSAFEWEVMKVAEIDGASTIETLKAIELRHSTQIPVGG